MIGNQLGLLVNVYSRIIHTIIFNNYIPISTNIKPIKYHQHKIYTIFKFDMELTERRSSCHSAYLHAYKQYLTIYKARRYIYIYKLIVGGVIYLYHFTDTTASTLTRVSAITVKDGKLKPY